MAAPMDTSAAPTRHRSLVDRCCLCGVSFLETFINGSGMKEVKTHYRLKLRLNEERQCNIKKVITISFSEYDKAICTKCYRKVESVIRHENQIQEMRMELQESRYRIRVISSAVGHSREKRILRSPTQPQPLEVQKLPTIVCVRHPVQLTSFLIPTTSSVRLLAPAPVKQLEKGISSQEQTMACELKMSADGKYHLHMLDRMRSQSQFFDTKIIVKHSHKNIITGVQTSSVKVIEAHKCVLAASGFFFHSKFLRRDKPKIEFDLSKEFWTADDLTAVIEFLYTGSITLCLDNILNVTYLAELFGISALENLCDKYATFFLSEKTFLPLYIALISNEKAISVSEKMMLHRDRLNEFVQSVFFSQLLGNEQLKKLTSHQMLLLIRNVVFYGMQAEDVLPVLQLAVNWPLAHKDTESVKVSEEMIYAALTVRLSNLNNFQRIEVENLLQNTIDNARVYYEICGAKLAVQFDNHIHKALAFVLGEIDENEFNTDLRREESACQTEHTEHSNVLEVKVAVGGKDEVALNTSDNQERIAETDTQYIDETTGMPIINPSCENNTALIKSESIDNPSPGIVENINNKIIESIAVEAPNDAGNANAASPEDDTKSVFQIKIELDIDSNDYNQDSGKDKYYASGIMSGIARQLSTNPAVTEADLNHLKTNVNIFSETYKNRKRENTDSTCSDRIRSKILNKISSNQKNDLTSASDSLAATDGPSDNKYRNVTGISGTCKLENLNTRCEEKDSINTFREYYIQVEKVLNPKIDDNVTDSSEETASATESIKDGIENDVESRKLIKTEITDEDEETVGANFYEYVLDQISHTAEDKSDAV